MAAFQNFRSALNGFNREDVVHYIEYINNKHASQINQLQTEISALREELAAYTGQPVPDPEQITQLEQERDAALSELESVKAQLADAQQQSVDELEAYRRAERAERIAKERVAQLYDQANGALAEATVRTDETATQICNAADAIIAQLTELQDLLRQGKITMKDAATAMYAIRPALNEE